MFIAIDKEKFKGISVATPTNMLEGSVIALSKWSLVRRMIQENLDPYKYIVLEAKELK